MNENTKDTALTPEQDYRKNFMPQVHVLGRSTMGLAMIFSFLPWAYFLLVKGYTLPISTYTSGIIGVASLGIGMWLSEPEAYWPVLGSAGTYIAYLSGNVGAMRFPVATAVQKNMNADITTPRGQIVTIVGIVASVVANLILLLITVLAGSWVLSILPQTVIDSFSFVVAGLLGAMVLMQFSGDGGKTIAVKDILIKIVYLVLAAFLYVVCNIWITSLMAWGMAIAVLSCILLSYVIYRIDLKKAESGEQ